MAPIDFYFLAESPPCRAVEMVARMVGVELNKKPVNLFAQEHLKEDFVKLYPLHQVPFIVDQNLKLGESRAIMMYLVNKYKPSNTHLYPAEPDTRALVDALLFYDIGTLNQALGKFFYPKMRNPSLQLDTENESSLKQCFAYLNKRIENGTKEFMLGEHITIADVSLVASLSLPDSFDYDLSEYKHLVGYLDRVKSAIPDYHTINDGPIENMKRLVQSKATS